METTKVTDQELRDEGATIKFGKSQLNNKTPDFISKIANLIVFLCAVWGLISMGITKIPLELKLQIAEWVMVSSGIIKLGSKFFGWQLREVE